MKNGLAREEVDGAGLNGGTRPMMSLAICRGANSANTPRLTSAEETLICKRASFIDNQNSGKQTWQEPPGLDLGRLIGWVRRCADRECQQTSLLIILLLLLPLAASRH